MTIKEYIKGELLGLMENQIDGISNMDEAIDIFLEVLKYNVPKESLSGVGEKVLGCLNSLTSEDLSRADYVRILDSLNSTELYGRIVLFLTNPTALENIEKDKLGYTPVLIALGFNQSHRSKMASRRNAVGSHGWEMMSMGSIYSQIDSFLLDYIKITDKKAGELKPIVFAGKDAANTDFLSDYMANIIKEYEAEVKSGFVYMDVHWTEEKEDSVDRNIDALVTDTLTKAGSNRYTKILGEAGSGKTTALKRIQYVLARRFIDGSMNFIPVLIHLGDLMQGETPFDALKTKLSCDTKKACELLKEGCVVMLLDGYNEILDGGIAYSVSKYIDLRLIVDFPKTFVFISDRMISRNNIPVLKLASNLYLKEISLEEKADYFSRKIEDEESKKLILDEVNNNPGYFDGINTPFKMNQFIEVVCDTKEIPFDLTEAYLKSLIERERNNKKEAAMRDIEDLLQAMAVYMSLNDQGDAENECEYLPRIKALEVLGKAKNALGFNVDTKHFLDVVLGMNILVEENAMIAFSNPDYYDYFKNEGLFNGMNSLFE